MKTQLSAVRNSDFTSCDLPLTIVIPSQVKPLLSTSLYGGEARSLSDLPEGICTDYNLVAVAADLYA